ncbi:uncharacterized protein DUF559 [Rhodococcus sp. OK519]|uniref:endonuclease domain-containing protein n=1 Tax=Rhodococcus sp. OK519 TaxID=2135729 RepID=UPI000D35E537|nr:uncharacterized protein DUF559 [Rhodococcus sp. OK519]
MTALLVPFRGTAALGRGLVSRRGLRRHYTRLYPDTYVHTDVEVDARIRALAVWQWADGRGALAGSSAAAMWGTKWVDPTAGVRASTAHLRPPRGIALYRDDVPADQITRRGGVLLTTPLRTAFDLGRRLEFDPAVEAVDALYQSTRITRAALAEFAAQHPGERGIIQLHRVIEDSDEGAESPWETRTRLALVRAGLPRPDTQLPIRDGVGRFIGRVDMVWERWRVIVEYDGDHHFDREQRNRDVERWNALEAAGWRVIRVKARQLHHGRATLIAQITKVLRDAGAPL